MERRTKIVATVGPASWDEPMLRQLLGAGVDVIRLNFSHATHDKAAQIIRMVRRISEEIGHNVAILQDLQGPRVRTGDIADPSGSVELKTGQHTILTTRPVAIETPDLISVDYERLPDDLKPDDFVLIDDGLLQLKVLSIAGQDIECEVLIGGKLSSHKGISFPTVTLSIPTITDKDKADLRFGLDHEVDFVALSFVRQAEDLQHLRQLMREYAPQRSKASLPQIIAKIEKHEAITRFDEILQEADAIMVARGDLGVEMLTEQVPILQKDIIAKCNRAGKPVITATQMLDSMIRNPRPTRAEASDVANAILDGTDAIMLSGESANGLYPIEAVKVMSRIACTAEQESLFKQPPRELELSDNPSITDAISRAVCTMGRRLGATAIISTTTSGFTARMVSRNRPHLPIYAVTHELLTLRRLALVWGVQALLCPRYANTDEMLAVAEKVVLQQKLVKPGDLVIMTAGVPVGIPGQSNLLKVHTVGSKN